MGQPPRLAALLLRVRLFAAVATSAIAAVSLSAGQTQTPQQRPVFRAGAVFVNVDAYPRRDGKVVEGLTKTDFEILEDGKPQSVESFEFVKIEPNAPDNERRDPNNIADSLRQAADPHNRIFVVYLDIFHTTLPGSHYAREPVIQFLDRAIGPTDLFGVMTPELPVGALTFGRRTETLSRELIDNWDWGQAERSVVVHRNDTERKLWACKDDGLVLAYREDLTASSLEALVDRLDRLRDERKNILFISEGWAPSRGTFGGGGGRKPRTPGIGVGPTGKLGIGGAASRPGEIDMSWCDLQSVRLANIDYDRRFRDLLASAQRANVAFYPVDVGGLRTFAPPINQPGVSAEAYRAFSIRRMDVLQELAINTDGTSVVSTNDLTGAVRKVADDLSAYYLLGYYTSNAAADGKYRRIEVKVKSPGVKVSARRGYLAPTEEMRRAEAAAAARPVREETAVDRELARLAKLGSDARLYTAAVSSSTGVDVIVEIATREFGTGAWTNGGTVKVDVTPRSAGGATVAAEARLEPGSRSAIVSVPLSERNPEGWRVRVRIDAGAATLDDEITVPSSPPASFVGEATVFRAGTGARSPLRAVADYLFIRTERIHVEWPIAKTADTRSARLLNRRGDAVPVPVALSDRADAGRTVVAADLVLAPLAAGDYVIELTAASGEEKLQRFLAFRVIR